MTLCKVIILLDQSEWHGRTGESLWGEIVSMDGDEAVIRLKNTPFFAKGLSFLDVVRAKRSRGEIFDYVGVVERSGHSTYVILCPVEQTSFDLFWNPLEAAGCTYEGGEINTSMGKMKMFAVDIPPGADIDHIYRLLERGESEGVWMFQESHFSGYKGLH